MLRRSSEKGGGQKDLIPLPLSNNIADFVIHRDDWRKRAKEGEGRACMRLKRRIGILAWMFLVIAG